jgi:hypothetical protein
MKSFISLVQLQKSPRFSIPPIVVSKLKLEVGDAIQCNFCVSGSETVSFQTKAPASREVHIPKGVAECLTTPDRIYLLEIRRVD